jgi:hypothetical protein
MVRETTPSVAIPRVERDHTKVRSVVQTPRQSRGGCGQHTTSDGRLGVKQ